MLKETERSIGTRGQLKGKNISGSAIIEPPDHTPPTLAELGIDKKISSLSQKIAGSKSKINLEGTKKRVNQWLTLLNRMQNRVNQWLINSQKNSQFYRKYIREKLNHSETGMIPILATLKSYKMKETLKHREAFEYYYSIGSKRSLSKLRDKLHQNSTETAPSLRTLKSWSKAFNWQKRIEQRDIEIGKELEKKTLAILF